MRSKIHKRDQNCEEAKDMQYQDQAFEMRKGLAPDSVNGDCKCKHGPTKQHCLIRLRRVIRIAH